MIAADALSRLLVEVLLPIVSPNPFLDDAAAVALAAPCTRLHRTRPYRIKRALPLLSPHPPAATTTLRTLEFGALFDQLIDQLRLPPSLTYLHFGVSLQQRLRD